jgi:hypothetical protein
MQVTSQVVAILGMLSGVVSVLFLTINVNNWATIASTLYKGAIGDVGFDAPIAYPLVIGLAATVVSWLLSKRKLSVIQIIGLSILLSVAFIWAFGLKLAVKNLFQP